MHKGLYILSRLKPPITIFLPKVLICSAITTKRSDNMKTAAAYIRVSTDDQVEYSPDSQLKAIRKYAKEHNMILPEEFIFVDA